MNLQDSPAFLNRLKQGALLLLVAKAITLAFSCFQSMQFLSYTSDLELTGYKVILLNSITSVITGAIVCYFIYVVYDKCDKLINDQTEENNQILLHSIANLFYAIAITFFVTQILSVGFMTLH